MSTYRQRDCMKGRVAAWRQSAGPGAPEALLILLSAPIVLMLWVSYGKQDSFVRLLGAVQWPWPQDAASTAYEYLSAFLLMFCLPALLVKTLFRKPLRDFGLGRGDARTGLRLAALALPFLLLAAYAGSSDPAVQAEYPLAKSAADSLPVLLTVEGLYLLYYLGWEFFFRGWMLFGLEKPYGAAAAVLIQTIPSVLVHIGKPPAECFASIAAGLIFGYAAWRTRSIFYPLLMHASVGIATDLFVILRLG